MNNMLNNIYINADDYGRSEMISQKIIECIDNGIINSVSVIMGADSSVYKQLAKRNIKTKLHVNLTDFPPSKGEGNESLMNMTFIKLLFLREKNRKVVKKEIDNQLEEYIKYFGTKSLMIDGHQHIQAIPWIYDYLTSLEVRIKEIRLPDEKFFFVNLKSTLNINFLRNLSAFLLLKFLVRFRLKNKLYSPNYSGMLYSGFYNEKILKTNYLLIKGNEASHEIAFHPGHTELSEIGQFKPFFYKYYSHKNRLIEYRLAKDFFLM